MFDDSFPSDFFVCVYVHFGIILRNEEWKTHPELVIIVNCVLAEA